MSDADWGGYRAAYSQESQGYRNAGGHAYVHPAHGGPSFGAPQPYGQAQGYQAPYGQDDYAYGATPGPGADQPATARGTRLAKLMNGAGALMSVALIAGLAVWGYRLAMRDVTGVPVVRALEGPMRVQPDDPGGVAAAHQGLAVNSVAAEGEAEGPTAQVALAPAPVALTEEDVPVHPMEAVAAGDTVAALEPGAPEALSSGEVSEEAILALVEDITEDAMPLSDVEELSAGATPLAGDVIPASVPGVAVSPRPEPRPVALVTRAATSPVELAVASAAAATEPDYRDISVENIPAGTRLVQLGAYDSADVARTEWDRIMARFSEVFIGKDRVIEKAQSGGKTFYRLRAMNFADLSDARRFCSALMAEQAACIPVVTR